MSTSYVTLPKTHGKVILHTTLGEVEIELFAKESPKACRNFVQLCMEGYYADRIFHRVVKDFVAQSGALHQDSGQEGECVYTNAAGKQGTCFESEFHSRLRFVTRGLVACAGQRDQNDSQFFITLSAAPQLNHKHTIFGQVVGDTLFNVLKVNDIEVDEETERPVYPPKITRAEVVVNPFDDIVPRTQQADTQTKETPAERKRRKRKAGVSRDISLLSFADEAGEDEKSLEESNQSRSVQSSHDLLRRTKVRAKDRETKNKSRSNVSDNISNSNSQDERSKAQSSSRHKRKLDQLSGEDRDSGEVRTEESMVEETPARVTEEATVHLTKTENVKKKDKKKIASMAMDYLSQQRQKYMKNKLGKERENDALMRVLRFTDTLNGGRNESEKDANEKSDDNDDSDGDAWKLHNLKFDTSRHAREKEKAADELATYDSLTHTAPATTSSRRQRPHDRKER